MDAALADEFDSYKSESTLLVLFIPSVDRDGQAIEQDQWVEKALSTLGNCFGGATAFPKARGVWRDDQRGGQLVFDEPVIIQCYTSEEAIAQRIDSLKTYLHEMGTQTRQGAVGLVIGNQYLEIGFPLGE